MIARSASFALLFALPCLVLAPLVAGCSSTDESPAEGAEQDVNGGAAIEFRSGFETKVSGALEAGQPVRVAYALDRLPQCRGGLPGGKPGWNIAGYYAENGGEAHAFEVTKVSTDDKSGRVAADATIKPSQGGDLAIWFQVTNRWGCSEFDSQFGQNFHFEVKGTKPSPEVSGEIAFGKEGEPKVTGTLKGGAKVKITYDQERLDGCYLSLRGNPAWSITGFAKSNDQEPRRFETGLSNGSRRQATSAILELPSSGKLSLWFEGTNKDRCSEFDSNDGANYAFDVE